MQHFPAIIGTISERGLKMKNQSLRTDDCFDEIVDRYSNMVYRIAFANVHVKTDADDIFQEVFLLYFKKNLSFESEEHRRNWLINVTLKYCKKVHSSSWYKKVDLSDEFPQLRSELNDNEYELYAAVQSLPRKYRNPIYLYYYEGFSLEEISNMLEIKPSTVRSQMKRGREKLKTILERDALNE